jgi:hypothetical protein
MPQRSGRCVSCVLAAALLPLLAADLGAQADDSRWSRALPARSWVRPPVADPLEPRFGVGLLQTDILSRRGPERAPFVLADPEDAERDLVAAVALGLTIPLYDLAQWRGGGLLLTGHAAVFSRFRIEYPSRDDMGQDWVVGGGLEAARNEWAGRLRIHHRSSHLGDEFAQATGATRIEFGGEAIEALVSRSLPAGARVYAGGGWIFHSNTAAETVLAQLGRDDRWLAQLGADIERYPWAGGRVGVRAGVDWQAAQRTNWQGAFAAAAGVEVRGHSAMGIMLRYFTGPSTMGEFFLTRESYGSVELTFRL